MSESTYSYSHTLIFTLNTLIIHSYYATSVPQCLDKAKEAVTKSPSVVELFVFGEVKESILRCGEQKGKRTSSTSSTTTTTTETVTKETTDKSVTTTTTMTVTTTTTYHAKKMRVVSV